MSQDFINQLFAQPSSGIPYRPGHFEPPIKTPYCNLDQECDTRVPKNKDSDWTPESYRKEYIDLWELMEVTHICGSNGCQREGTIAWTLNYINRYKERYVQAAKYVSKELEEDIPWQLIGALHMRESGGDFDKQILNGQHWNRRTTWVPRGLGPWNSWEESCVDAFRIKDRPDVWNIANTLYFAERFNGMGYRMYHKERVGMSPYIAAFTQFYKGGLYYSDGKFDSRRVAKGVGVAMILKGLGFEA